MRLPLLVLTCLTTATVAFTLPPRPAHACGGTFCDAGPTAMPVDQTGENILFVIDGPSVEAHIQIQYDPRSTAEQFAWVIPVQAVPEFSIGSDPLFSALLSGTVPSYGITTTSACMGPQDGDDGSPPPQGGFISPADAGAAGVDVVLQETVGALEITVLSGGTVQELVTWLDDNGYQQDPNAEPILAEYLAEGWMFAAIKLANAAGVDEIHPLVMRYDSGEACVPLKLTRIAAQDDMEVRTFFLGDTRIAPTNYDHVLVNPLKLDWLNNAANYKEVITLAVDNADADGKAFVTEYAGPSNVVFDGGIFDPAWLPDVFVDIAPVEVIDVLNSWGLATCDQVWGGCGFNHPLVLPLVRQYLPAPAGVDEETFWMDLAAHADAIDMTAWDGPAFAAAFAERIVEPGLHASDLLATWPYLTRMYTTISPHEMTNDPIFHPHPNLPDVDNRQQFANQAIFCTGDSAVTLPDGREVFIPAGDGWPAFQREMPWVEDVEEIPDGGMPPIPLIDHTQRIDELLAQWNAMHDWPPGPGGDPTGGEDTDGSAATDGDTNGTGTGTPATEEPYGCGCTSGSGPTGALAMLVGIALARTRRRAR